MEVGGVGGVEGFRDNPFLTPPKTHTPCANVVGAVTFHVSVTLPPPEVFVVFEAQYPACMYPRLRITPAEADNHA